MKERENSSQRIGGIFQTVLNAVIERNTWEETVRKQGIEGIQKDHQQKFMNVLHLRDTMQL